MSNFGCLDMTFLSETNSLRLSPAVQVDPHFEVDGRVYTLGIARTRADRTAAYRLVFQNYQAQGFTDPDDLPLWYSIHNSLPETVTFVVRNAEGALVASGTVVPDSPLGLPMERMYAGEVDALRRAGRRVCEINSLVSCVASEGWRGRVIIMKIFSAAFWYARDILEADDLLCVTSPGHARFYRRALLLDAVGPLRPDPHANGAASVLLRLDTRGAEAAFRRRFETKNDARDLYRFFVPSQTEIAALETWMQRQVHPLNEADFHHLFLRINDLVTALPPDQLQFLQEIHPHFCFWQTAFPSDREAPGFLEPQQREAADPAWLESMAIHSPA